MLMHRSVALILTIAALGATTSLSAQSRSAVSGAELNAAAAARPTGAREAVQAVLATEQAGQLASRLGMSASELSTRAAALDDATLNQIAQQSGLGDPFLAGGDSTVVISTTAIIIVLLILILIAV